MLQNGFFYIVKLKDMSGTPAVIRTTVSLCNLAMAANNSKPPYSLAKLRGRYKTLPALGSMSMNASKTFQNLFDPVLYLDANNYIAGSTTWADTSGNAINFTVDGNVLNSNSLGIRYMNFSGGAGGARRVVNGSFSNVPYSSNATFVAFTTILNDTSTWRSLIRDDASNHPIIIQAGSNNLGGFFFTSGFLSSGFAISNIPNPYTSFNMLAWKFSNSNPFYEFLFNEQFSSSVITNSNSAWTVSFSQLGCKYQDLSTPSQYWGNIGLALYYNRHLNSNELNDIYARFAPRFFDPSTMQPSVLDGGSWSVLYQTSTAQRNASGNIVYAVNNMRMLTGMPFTRVAYYMQNKMLNGSTTYWAFASMDAYTAALSNYAFPDASNLITNQRNTSNMTVISNHPQVINGGGLQGRLEIWPHSYTSNPTFGDGTLQWDYDDTPQVGTINQTSGYGSFQVHDISNKATVFAWNAHLTLIPPELGFGTNNASNIHYYNANNGQPDWTFTHARPNAGAYNFKCQVLLNTNFLTTQNMTQFLYLGNTFSYPGTGASWTDVSGNGTVSTIFNSPTFTNNYLTFNGTTQYALVPSQAGVNDFTVSDNYSVGFWVWLSSTQNDTASGDNDVVEKWNNGAGAYPYVFRYVRNNSFMVFAVYNGSVALVLSSPSNSIPTNTWVHVVGTMNHSVKCMSLYINGKLASQYTGASATITGNISNNIEVNIMRRGAINYVTGRFSMLYIYNRELNAHDVAQNHQATRVLYGV
jgi:hypothetical protein